MEHYWIAHRVVEPGRTLFHLADNHVRPIRRTLKDWIGYPLAQCSPSPPTDHIVASTCKSEGENVEIGDRSGGADCRLLHHGILGHGEVPVDVKVCLNQRDGDIHRFCQAARRPPGALTLREIDGMNAGVSLA